MKLAKAHGLGNDFLLVEAADSPEAVPAWARRLCDRHTGMGADGVLLYEPGEGEVRMRLVNADGSDAEISGNGVRCLAAYMVWKGRLPPDHEVRTVPGPRRVQVQRIGGSRFRVGTDLGVPRLGSAEIPVALDPPRSPVMDHRLKVAGRDLRVTATSLGNPHCAVFLPQPATDEVVGTLGPALESHRLFPQKTNVEFVTVLSPSELRVRFWERGVGPTRASGTGAASAAVAAIIKGLAERQVRVLCDGGVLEVDWPEGGAVHQVGEVEVLFEGEWIGPSA